MIIALLHCCLYDYCDKPVCVQSPSLSYNHDNDDHVTDDNDDHDHDDYDGDYVLCMMMYDL